MRRLLLFTILLLVATTSVAQAQSKSTVRHLQWKLATHSYLPSGSVTGNYGQQTHDAVLAFQSRNGLTRDGVAGPQTRRAIEHIRTPKPWANNPNRHVEISLPTQTATLVYNNRVLRTFAVSTGMGGFTTPSGKFAVYMKDPMSYSNPYGVYMPWSSYFTGGIALHEGVTPGYETSHGCVHVPPSFAHAVYNWVRVGTPVYVH